MPKESHVCDPLITASSYGNIFAMYFGATFQMLRIGLQRMTLIEKASVCVAIDTYADMTTVFIKLFGDWK